SARRRDQEGGGRAPEADGLLHRPGRQGPRGKRKRDTGSLGPRARIMTGASNENRVPAHVGLIMDGNGRWAKARGLPRTEGHREGLKTAKVIVKAAEDLGIKYLSLYVFSTENWKRAAEEVGFLMGLIKQHLSAELDFYRSNGVRVLHSGDSGGLPEDIVREIREVEAETASFDKMTVN